MAGFFPAPPGWRVGLLFSIALAFACGLTSTATAADSLSPVYEWTEQHPSTSPSKRYGATMAFDPSTGQTVLFGGHTTSGSVNETWVWDGSDWSDVTPVGPGESPSARYGSAMAFDPAIGRVVLFGGHDGSSLGDTWIWNGNRWNEATPADPAASPPPRSGASMAFDAASGKMVLFGGWSGALGQHGDTWTWNGKTWTEASPATSPPRRYGANMAFDPSTGRPMLFGGRVAGDYGADTWAWDGNEWSDVTPTDPDAIPPPREHASMAFDPSAGRMILFGGYAPGDRHKADTWAWDGTGWARLSPASGPPARDYASMAFDPSTGRIVLFGGGDPGRRNDTWTFGPPRGVKSNWAKREPRVSPSVRQNASMAFDPSTGEIVLFGGFDGDRLDETWVWDGSNWTERHPATRPPARSAAQMAFDQSTGKMVLFGGFGHDGSRRDTWLWDGTDWTEANPATRPAARAGANLVFDPASGGPVLFGGWSGGTVPGDTWIWNGSDWVERKPATLQPPRQYAGAAFDPSIGAVVRFGGYGGAGDTWVWDGIDWAERHPAVSPSHRASFGMDFDPSTGNVILFGGETGDGTVGDTWAWDGTTWSAQDPVNSPPAARRVTMAFDPSRGEMVLFGGRRDDRDVNETWVWSLQVQPPTASIDSPTGGGTFRIGESISTEFSCEEAPGGPGLESCEDSNGGTAPDGALDTSSAGSHTYTVTATSENGLTGTAQISYTVDKAAPGIAFSSAGDAELGGSVTAGVNLTAGHDSTGRIVFRAHGPDDPDCSAAPVFESAPVPVNGDGGYDSPGFTPAAAGEYRWVASYGGDASNEASSTTCGEDGSTSRVTEPPKPDPDPEPGPDPDPDPDPAPEPDPEPCPAVKLNLRLASFGITPPFGNAAKRPGFRVRVVGRKAILKVRPTVRYRVDGRLRKAPLKARRLKMNKPRNFRFRVPKKMKRDFRRAGKPLRRARVTFVMKGKARPQGTKANCFRKVGPVKLRTSVVLVSGRVALRRLGR